MNHLYKSNSYWRKYITRVEKLIIGINNIASLRITGGEIESLIKFCTRMSSQLVWGNEKS